MTPPQMGGEYNPLTGETDPPHYPDLPGGHHDLQRDFTSPLGQGSPGNIAVSFLSLSSPRCELKLTSHHFSYENIDK